jgi:hydrogenase maturation protease
LEPWEISSQGKIVVLGIGNPYMHDDAIGPRVVDELRKLNVSDKVLVFDYGSLDLALLAYFKNSSKIVIIDALKAGVNPGTVSKYIVSSLDDSKTSAPNLHELELHDIVDLASQTGVMCPIVVVGVEPKDCSPGEGLSAEVGKSLPNVINDVLIELNQPGA